MSEFIILTGCDVETPLELGVRPNNIICMRRLDNKLNFKSNFITRLTIATKSDNDYMYCKETPTQILKKIEEAQNGGTLPGTSTNEIQPSSRADFHRKATQELSEE